MVYCCDIRIYKRFIVFLDIKAGIMSGRKEFADRFRRVSGIYNIVDDKQVLSGKEEIL